MNFSYWLFAEQLLGKTLLSAGLNPTKGEKDTRIEVPVFTPPHAAGVPNACERMSVYRYVQNNYQPQEKKELELLSDLIRDYINALKNTCPAPVRIGFLFRDRYLSAWIVTDVNTKETLCFYEADMEIAQKYEDSGIEFVSELCQKRFCCALPEGYTEFPLHLLSQKKS